MVVVFDVVNNADRKGDHVLAMSGRRRYGLDHGLTFHRDPKLRTVLRLNRRSFPRRGTRGRRVHEGLQGELGEMWRSCSTPRKLLRSVALVGAVSGSELCHAGKEVAARLIIPEAEVATRDALRTIDAP
jgi:hypothetical protein